jgi:arabinogalactan oligomer/maltooligosaccharide transport system permease protein
VTGLVVKLAFLFVVNSVPLFFVAAMIREQAWLGLVATIGATLAIDYAYLSRRSIPLKYLLPGTLFLLCFQVYPVVYTGYIAFTNYGTGNILTRAQAIERIQAASVRIPPDAVRYSVAPLRGDGGELALLLTDPDGEAFVGTTARLAPVDEVGAIVTDGDQIAAVGPYERLGLGDAQAFATQLQQLRVPVEGGQIQLQSFTSAALAETTRVYDPETQKLTDAATGTTYTASRGSFVDAEGNRLTPGWRVAVGPDNFVRFLTSPLIRGPFVQVFVWTYAFAILSVLLTFALGLALAITLNHPDLRGKKLYRGVLIIPYALPSFMTALIWAGLLNTQFGAVNRILGASIPWLADPVLAKVSVLLVNLWLGFPYMFLVCTGALQAIPGELLEASAVDGASAPQRFRRVTLPLLLVAVSPLLIASFAFNFNNFNTIYLLNQGGPPIVGARTPAGHTDILISYVFRLAFESGRGSDYGLAAAISVLIFVMVAGISAYSFRFTRGLEEVN